MTVVMIRRWCAMMNRQRSVIDMTHTKKWRLNKGSYKPRCKDGYAIEYEVESLGDGYMDGNPTRIRPKLIRIKGD